MGFFKKEKKFISKLDYNKLKDYIILLEKRKIISKDQIESLKEKLKCCRKAAPRKMPSGIVTMNSKVKLNVLNTGNTLTVELVYPFNENKKQLKISVFSPMGTAILAGKIGECIDFSTGISSHKVEIIDIIFQPGVNKISDM